jgi:hypothetical protein
MKNRGIIVAALLAAAALAIVSSTAGGGPSALIAVGSQPASGPASQPPEGPQVVRLRVTPAAEPLPALRWRLMPDVLDTKPGNAALLYYQALGALAGNSEENRPDFYELLKMPLAQMPLPKAKEAIGRYSAPIRLIKLAAERESCDWGLPVREQGLDLLVPSLSHYRQFARALAMEARVALAEGRVNDAIATIRTGMAMAHHVAEMPTLISVLVAVAIEGLMLNEVQEIIGERGSPNLYWALASLPQPLVSVRKAMQWEHDWLEVSLRPIPDRTKVGAADEWSKVLSRLTGVFTQAQAAGPAAEPKAGWSALAAGFALKHYSNGKKYLLAQGVPDKDVQAMPVAQVVTIYLLDEWERVRDDHLKWYSLPYWQAAGGIAQADRRLQQAMAGEGAANPLLALLPSLGRAYFNQARTERHLAALQLVEAIRAYAAGHGGRAPANLDELTDLPAPLDPVTGKPFEYKPAVPGESSGLSCTIDMPAPKGMSPRDGMRLEITILAAPASRTATQPAGAKEDRP